MNEPKMTRLPMCSQKTITALWLLTSFFATLVSSAQSQQKAFPKAAVTPQVEINAEVLDNGSVTITSSVLGTSEKFSAHLNGKDVSGRFSSISCDGATCKTATLTQADGLRFVKDVLMIDTGHGVTGRIRFDTKTSSDFGSGSTTPSLRPMAVSTAAIATTQAVSSQINRHSRPPSLSPR